jgi:hypothetical protein
MSLDINLTGVENTSNKKTNLTDNSDTFYPTQKAVKTAVDAKENTITAGTTAQYFRGDKTFQTLDKTAVGLSNVDNTSDANKPVSTDTQTALNAKFNTPTGTTAQYIRGDGSLDTFPTIPDPSDFVEKSDFTSHSILAKQSGASDPVAVSIGNNEILGRKSGGGSNIEGLSVSEVKSLLNYTASDVGAVATNSAITGATKTKITYDAKGLVTSGADATTADIADSTDKRYQTDAQKTNFTNPKITVECIDALTVDFYAMYTFQIDSVTAITNSPTTTILVNDSSYTFGVSIATGAKITVTLNTAGVVNLNTTRL